MKRAFLEPGMEVIKFQDEDIITTSVIEDNAEVMWGIVRDAIPLLFIIIY